MKMPATPTISFSCSSCGVKITTPETMSGEQLGCPKCKANLSVPYALSAMPPSTGPLTPVRPLPSSMPKATQRAQIQPLPPSLVAVKPRKVVQILSVTVGIMAIVIVVLVVLLLRKEGNGGRQSGGSSQSAAGISKTCTLPELAEYLIKHKIAAEVGSYMHASPPHPFSSDKGKMPLVFIDGEYDSASILIIECDDELSAKHGASANARLWSLRQYYWINWGRFAFQVQNEATAKQITELLR